MSSTFPNLSATLKETYAGSIRKDPKKNKKKSIRKLYEQLKAKTTPGKS